MRFQDEDLGDRSEKLRYGFPLHSSYRSAIRASHSSMV